MNNAEAKCCDRYLIHSGYVPGLHSRTLESTLGQSVRLVNRGRTKVAFRLFSYRLHKCAGISGPSSTSTRQPQTQKFETLPCSSSERSAAFVNRQKRTNSRSWPRSMRLPMSQPICSNRWERTLNRGRESTRPQRQRLDLQLGSLLECLPSQPQYSPETRQMGRRRGFL